MRPSEVAAWPAWELSLLDHFLAREPAPDDRVEIAVARLAVMFADVHKAKGEPRPKLLEFLPYKKAWPEEKQGGRYSEIDREIMKAML